MPRPVPRSAATWPLVGAIVATFACSGCAVIEIANKNGCASYLVLGFARIDPMDGGKAGVAHVAHTQLGMYAEAGAAPRFGLGYVRSNSIHVAPDTEALVETETDAAGARRVRVNLPRRESDDAKPSPAVVCVRAAALVGRMHND